MHKYIAKEPTGEVYRVENIAVAQGLHRKFSLVVEKQRRMCLTRLSEHRTSFYWTKRAFPRRLELAL